MAERLPVGANAGYLDRVPERLVVEGFRRWMAGYDTGDIQCWELAWNLYAKALGPKEARMAISELSCWVRAIRSAGNRSVCLFPYGCKRLCRDECMAVSMLAGVQHGDEHALKAAAFELVGEAGILETIEAARTFGSVLDSIGQHLLAVPRPVIDDIAQRPPREQFH
ncbi:hypothetical protein [Breoghania sp. L-A4]|uniref:hypothetical protein n=1 Tax=Breoghania sp. L-A4 TaxID=2304600 RepID=UPI000E35894F|nr:hypothetical protein [Breoghania sp. L-A4]AXS42125.1 hypothetical protein D1F64_21630 [Breoghania sp. L-A4]